MRYGTIYLFFSSSLVISIISYIFAPYEFDMISLSYEYEEKQYKPSSAKHMERTVHNSNEGRPTEKVQGIQ